MTWTTLGEVVNVGSVLTFTAGGVAVNTYKTYVSTSPSESLLGLCKTDLEKVEWRLNQLTPRQREEIYALNQQGECKGLEEIERKYLRLLDDSDELCEQCAESSFFQRRLPSSQLMVDVNNLRQQVVALQKDTWNTTTSRNREANRLAQAQREQVEHQPPLSSPSPTAGPRPQSTNAQSSTIGPEEYPLNVVYPATAHIAARQGATELPPGLV